MFDIPIIHDENPVQEQVINQCIGKAAEAYQINPILLRAIREQEQGEIGMKNLNSDGSYDLGPFQVNTVHAGTLYRQFGITEHQLQYDPCTNAAAAAWHLRLKINENKGNIWKGVAWYHSKTPSLGRIYKKYVVDKYTRLVAIHKRNQSIRIAHN